MTYAHKVTRVTLSGTMFGGAEEWSTGFFLGQEGSDSTVPTQAAADLIKTAWATFWTTTNSVVSGHYRFDQVKMAQLGVDGKTIPDTQIYSYPATATYGGTSANAHPPQCALVVTLLSDRPRGRASKGRMYLPGFSGAMQSTGKISTTDQTNIANNLKTFFDALTGQAAIPDQLILASRAGGAFSQLLAQNDYVETIRVGDVVDTQRRRRNGLQETYTSRTLA